MMLSYSIIVIILLSHIMKRSLATLKICVVSGASRGIGAEFTRQLLRDNTENKVFALMRNPSCETSQVLKSSYGDRYVPLRLDLEDQTSIDTMSNELTTHLGIGADRQRVDLLINAAGVLGGADSPERSLESLKRSWLEHTLQVNLVGHIMVSKAVVPFMKKRDKADSSLSKIVSISARVGSIEDNKLGGWYSYRMSKAALNMFTKTSSIELKRYNIASIAIHPGTTDTDLSAPFQKNIKPGQLQTVEDSVSKMLNVINNCSETGILLAYDGSKIQW